mmetsp:Transcript_3521/g.8022  ORF Transcript_3521/g.8022 Transcript_3521/m.8022 type:complete len:95 (+) Transcript_3521:110-394(+)
MFPTIFCDEDQRVLAFAVLSDNESSPVVFLDTIPMVYLDSVSVPCCLLSRTTDDRSASDYSPGAFGVLAILQQYPCPSSRIDQTKMNSLYLRSE